MKAYEKYVSKADIEKIYEYSLKILAEVGVRFEHEEALEVFKRHGFKVEDCNVYFTRTQVEDALKLVPREFEFVSFKGNLKVGGSNPPIIRPLGGNIYLSENGKIRKMENEDIFNQAKLADTSDVIMSGEINPILDYSGFETEDQRIFGHMALQMKYCNKPALTLYPDFGQVPQGVSHRQVFKNAIQMVKRFEGVEDGYVIQTLMNPLTPLTYDNTPIEKMFALAEEKQPVWMAPCAMPMMTAPPSVAGMVAMGNAETLAGIVFAQLLQPGLPIIFANTSCSTDMRTIQLAIGAPETALVSYATAGLADYYGGIPFRTGGALSDAKDCDIQAGVESMMMLFATFDAGANFIEHCIGTMGSFNVVNFEKFIMDEEIVRMVRRILRGVDCSDEKMCFETIKKVGPRGTFLQGRTPKMYREEFFMPKYLNKQDPKEWQLKGSVSMQEKLHEAVEARLQSWTPPVIEKDRLAVIDRFIPQKYKDTI